MDSVSVFVVSEWVVMMEPVGTVESVDGWMGNWDQWQYRMTVSFSLSKSEEKKKKKGT